MNDPVSVPGEKISDFPVLSLRQTDMNPFRAKGTLFGSDFDLSVAGRFSSTTFKKT